MIAAARAVVLAPLFLALTLVPARAQMADGSTLRFLPNGVPLTFRQRDVTVEVKVRAGETPKTRRTELARTVRRTVTPATSETIKLKIDLLAVNANVDGRTAPPPPMASPLVSLLTPRGLKLLADGTSGPPNPLALMFPAAPMLAPVTILGSAKPDDRPWTVESPPTVEIPIRVSTSYRAVAVEKFQGRNCLVIEVSAKSAGKADGGKRLIELFGRGRLLFDPAAGVVVDSRTELRVDDSAVPVPRTGLQRTHTETLSTATLVP